MKDGFFKEGNGIVAALCECVGRVVVEALFV